MADILSFRLLFAYTVVSIPSIFQFLVQLLYRGFRNRLGWTTEFYLCRLEIDILEIVIILELPY